MKRWHLAALAALTICGCGRSGSAPKIQELPITGKVTLDGQPLPGADVVFALFDPPVALAGKTGEDGSYQLQTVAQNAEKVQGAAKVTISRLVKPDGTPLSAEETPADTGAVEQLPGKYSRYEMTTLTANINPQGSTIDFPLTSR